MLFFETTPLAAALDAEWVFPTAECFHIVGFGIAIGTIALVDLSLLGAGLRRKAAARLLKATEAWTLIALTVVVLAGMVLFLTDPREYFLNVPFRFKIVCLLLAIVFNYTIHRRVVLSERAPAAVSGLVGAVSLMLWSAVVVGGLFIAFFPKGF